MKKKLLAMSVLAAISTQAYAFQFDTSDDWEIRWDNTVKANVSSRVSKQDPDVYEGGRGNSEIGAGLADDATLSVDRSGLGLISTRLDVLSEFDVIFRDNFGFRISASGWYDHAYSESDHPSNRRQTWASPSVAPGKYTDEAKDLHHFGGEILDAFVFANWDIGETALGVRAGRHTIYWGNSLLATGAIAGVGGAMAPIDFSKALSVPGSEAKELFMPTAKLSGVLQLTDNLTLNAYYSFEHQRYRLPETGTYFSPAEGLTEDTGFATFIPGDPTRIGLQPRKDVHSSDEWGFNIQYWVDAWALETSFIYLNYVDKNLHGLHAGFDTGQYAYFAADSNPLAGLLLGAWTAGCAAGTLEPCPPNPPTIDPDAGTVVLGQSKWLFKDDIDLFAISLAKEIAGVSVGADIVYRKDTGLAPDLSNSFNRFYGAPESFVDLIDGALPFAPIPGDYNAYDSSNYLGPVGDIMSVVINGVGLLKGGPFWDGGTWILEATFQMLESCGDNCKVEQFESDGVTLTPEWAEGQRDLVDYRVYEDRVVSTIGGVFKPTWYQVRPGWDMSLPMAISYTIDGEKSPFTFGGDEERGSGSIGVELSIDQTWTVNARYNAYFGPVAAGIGGLLKDRDNISLTVKRTF